MGLELYYEKRDFRRTPEPKGKVSRTNRCRFVVQEHHAEKLHFDFRLEMGGVLKSWSIPRGPSLDPSEKRLAVPTEDHPVEYLKFEGHIPEGNYGAGEHMKWDGGTYEPVGDADALAQYWVVFDLDPENVDFTVVCEMAVSTRDVLEKLGLESYVKTSGSRGLHIYVPVKAVHDYDAAARFAELVARLVVRENPSVATVERSLKKRQHARIYIDHMQNARGKSVVAPYSVRPRPGAPVSAPLDWDEVKGQKIRPQEFTIKNIAARLARRGDLFKPVLNGRQTLDEALLELETIFSKKTRKSTRAGA